MTCNRRAAAVLGSLLLLSVIAPITAEPVSAAEAQRLVVVGDYDGDGNADLTLRDGSADTVLKVVEAGGPSYDFDHVTTSADGRRFAYVRTFSSTAGRQQLVVADAGGRQVRVVEDVNLATSYINRPSFSPDGQTIAFPLGHYGDVAGDELVYQVPVASGAPTRVRGGYGVFAVVWTSATELLGVDYSRSLVRFTATTRYDDTRPVTGSPQQLRDVVASPVAGRLAMARTINFGSERSLVTASYADGALTEVTAITSGSDDYAPAYSPDGSAVLFARCGPCGAEGPDLWRTPADGSGQPVPVTRTADRAEVSVGAVVVDDIAPNAVPTLGMARLAGTTAQLTVTGLESDASGVLVTRSRDGSAEKVDTYAPVSDGTFVDTGLVVGQTYTYTVREVDTSGNPPGPPSAARSLTATLAPIFAVADPTSRAHLTTPFLVTFNTANHPSTTYDVSYRDVATSRTSTPWATNVGASRIFGQGGLPVTVAPGANYSFSGRARDGFGNSTALYVTGVRAVVPLDQSRALFTSTAVTTSGPALWLGSMRTLSTAGQRATVGVVGNRLQVIGNKGPTGGSFDVYLKGDDGVLTRVASSISTYAITRSTRQVLYTNRQQFSAGHIYELRWAAGATSTRRDVAIDGFGVRR